MTDFRGQRISVLGLGHFGGGVAVSRWLVEQGARVVVYDQEPAEKLSDSLQLLADLPIEFRLGPNVPEADVINADLIVASPAIPPHNRYMQAARDAKIPLTTEICLFVQRCRAPVIGVTGTKGKSTTSTLLQRMLATTGTTWLGGNIGKSLLVDLPNIQPDHLVVLELSSFMLDHLGKIGWSPQVAVVTMISTDHLDWHGTEANYLDAKRNIVRFQTESDFAVVDPSSAFAETKASLVTIPTQPRFELRLAGEHNQFNAQAAYAAAALFGVDWSPAQKSIADFTGLAHRLEQVHEADGVRFINDSISTIPEAAIAALNSFPSGKVIQIVGGSDRKKLPADALCAALAQRAKAVLCIGETADKLAAMLPGERTHVCGTLDAAVAKARKMAEPGDIVLLSPGHPSHDQFTNFESRGAEFSKLSKMSARE